MGNISQYFAAGTENAAFEELRKEPIIQKSLHNFTAACRDDAINPKATA